MKLIKSKRGISIMDVGSVMLAVGVGVIITAIVAIVLAAFQTGQTTNSLSYNITGQGLNLLTNVTAQFGTIGTIFGAALLLGAVGLIGVGGYMAYKRSRE
jgi:hypothetical protein